MLLAPAKSADDLPDVQEMDPSCVESLWGGSTSQPASLKRTKSRSITKSDLDAFMGDVDHDNAGPFANLRHDIGSVLKGCMSPHERMHFVNPFKVHSSDSSTVSSLAIVKDALPLFAEMSDCESECGLESEIALAEHRGNECLSEGLSVDAERIFSIMTELSVLYNLETCLVSIRENKGERFFVVHCVTVSELWRTQMFVGSAGFSQLLVHRGIPTIIPDMSKDSRFSDAIDARSKAERFLVQAPLGWKDDEDWIGVVNLVGKQPLSCASLQDYDALMKRADEIASLAVARRQ